MSEEYKTYQPKWEEKVAADKERHSHHDHHYTYSYSRGKSSNRTNTWGGWLKLRDVQAYYGLMFIVIGGLLTGLFFLGRFIVQEVREMPNADPATELKVDELGVRMGDEYSARLHSDSVINELNLDSSAVHSLSAEKHNVYRPPKKDWKEWNLTTREWKNFRYIFSIWYDENGLDWQMIVGIVLVLSGGIGIIWYLIRRRIKRTI